MANDYRAEIRRKEQEIHHLQQSYIRDSIRIAYFELGEIHYKYGNANDALKAWIKSHDCALVPEDLQRIALKISMAAFECMIA